MDILGGICDPLAIAVDEAATKVVRHQFPYLLRIALCSTLVRSLERKVVCRFFTDHVSAPSPAMVGARLPHHRARPGVYGRAVCGHLTFGVGSLSFFATVG